MQINKTEKQIKKQAKKPILVVGLGPAGAAVANFLSRLGYAVVAIDSAKSEATNGAVYSQSGRYFKIGESLPPDAKHLLQQLDVWHSFETQHHLKCYGNKSYWHSDKPSFHDFIQHSVGHGWHIDRVAFEQLLIDKATSLGVDICYNTSVKAMTKLGQGWQVTLDEQGRLTTSDYRFVIDASGRKSVVAKQLGVERLYEVEQLALVAFLSTKTPLSDSYSLIETIETEPSQYKGWWYSASIPAYISTNGAGQVACAFMFNPSEQSIPIKANEASWQCLMALSKHTKSRLATTKYELLSEPKLVAADSSILQQTHGEDWLAVGDAAMSYDPLAAHGLMMAMVSARDGAAAIDGALNGKNNTLAMYSKRMAESFLYYCSVRRELVDASNN